MYINARKDRGNHAHMIVGTPNIVNKAIKYHNTLLLIIYSQHIQEISYFDKNVCVFFIYTPVSQRTSLNSTTYKR